MSKSVTTFTTQLVTFDTTLPFTEVVTRLENEVNKQGSAQIISMMKKAEARADIEETIEAIKGVNDFVYFLELAHHKWLNKYDTANKIPATIVYTIGNPILAQKIIKLDRRAAYNIPPRLLVLEKADGTGTNVLYHLPSSVMSLTGDPDLQVIVEHLDRKLEDMITRITAVDKD